jgi:hypothetical protein
MTIKETMTTRITTSAEAIAKAMAAVATTRKMITATSAVVGRATAAGTSAEDTVARETTDSTITGAAIHNAEASAHNADPRQYPMWDVAVL